MRITKQRLRSIIEEEVVGVVDELKDKLKKKKKKSEKQKSEEAVERVRKQRKMDDLRWGGSDMRRLAVGIYEFNAYRNKDGEFSSKKDAATYSTYFVDGVRKNLKGATKSVKNSGRGENNTQGKYRLKDGTPKWENKDSSEEEIRFSMSMKELSGVVEDCVAEFIKKFGEKYSQEPDVIEDGVKIDWKTQCSKRGFRSYPEILQALNNLVAASKGDLGKA